MYLTGFKIHHMNEKNWARNAHVEISGWQMSDNTRSFGFSKKENSQTTVQNWRFVELIFQKSIYSYVIKACKPAAGAQKTFTDSVFVGMTRNTGHRLCNNHSNRIGDLAHVKTCGSSMDDDEEGSLNYV